MVVDEIMRLFSLVFIEIEHAVLVYSRKITITFKINAASSPQLSCPLTPRNTVAQRPRQSKQEVPLTNDMLNS